MDFDAVRRVNVILMDNSCYVHTLRDLILQRQLQYSINEARIKVETQEGV